MSELERALVALGRELAVPAAPDLAPHVLARISSPAPRDRRGRRLVLVAAVVLLAALLAVLAVPDARSALARFLHIGAVRVEVVDDLPEVRPAEGGLEHTLGLEVPLEEARRRVGFELLELDEPPDRVYVAADDTVWFLYGEPDAVRLLVAQTASLTVDPPFLTKLVDAGTTIRGVRVRGRPAFHLSGGPHTVFLVDELGRPVEESVRLARDVLLWIEGGRTVRLEGDFDEAAARRLAESLSVRPRG